VEIESIVQGTDILIDSSPLEADVMKELHEEQVVGEAPREQLTSSPISEVPEYRVDVDSEVSAKSSSQPSPDSAADEESVRTPEMSTQSILEVLESQLRDLNTEKSSQLQQLSDLNASCQLKDAECRQMRDDVKALQSELDANKHLLEEAQDREDDLQKAVEATQAELRQSECR